MKTISKRELNQQTAQVLDGIHIGDPVLVTERGIARWRIEAVEASTDPIARLRAEGRIQSARSRPHPWPSARARYSPAQVDALFTGSRGER